MKDKDLDLSEHVGPAMGLTDIVIESMEIGLFVVDDDYNILVWNQFMESYTGLSKQELLGRNLFEYFTHLKETGWPERYEQIFDGGPPFKIYNSPALMIPMSTTVTGAVYHNILLYPLLAGQGIVKGILTVIEDVTERKSMEDRVHDILEYANDSIFILDVDGKFTYVNQKTISASGLGKEEIIGKFFIEIVDPSSLDTVASAFDKLLSGEEVRELQCTIVDGRGQKVRLEINAGPILSRVGTEISAIQGMARNVTEKRLVEEEIRGLKELAERILATIPSGVAMVDRNLMLLSVNNAYCQMFLTTEGESIGRNLIDFLPAELYGDEETIEKWVLEVLETVRAGQTYESRGIRYRNAKGEWMLDFRMVPIPGGQGKALLVVEDVTEREKLEEQKRARIRLEAEVENLKKVDELKTEFISVASHELRTPLTGIMIYLERLEDGKYCDVTEGHHRKILMVISQVKLLAKIVEEMLDTSRLEAKLEDLQIEPTHIKEVVFRSVVKVAPMTENKSQQIEQQIPDDFPKVGMDPERIERVVTNLLSNASNYSPPNTRIRIIAEAKEDGIEVKVMDQGSGISDEHKARVFDRFYVIDRGLTRKVGGVGLGLSIAKGIVENHVGRIWVEDSKEGGSSFIFFLPFRSLVKKVQGTR